MVVAIGNPWKKYNKRLVVCQREGSDAMTCRLESIELQRLPMSGHHCATSYASTWAVSQFHFMGICRYNVMSALAGTT